MAIKKRTSQKMGVRQWVIIMILGIIGIGVGVWGVIGGLQKSNHCTETTTATLVDWDEQTRLSGSAWFTYYYPIVSYEVNGETLQVESDQDFGDRQAEVGSTLEIRYNPNNPESFLIVTGSEEINGLICLLPLGAVIFLLGLVKIIVNTKKNKKSVPDSAV